MICSRHARSTITTGSPTAGVCFNSVLWWLFLATKDLRLRLAHPPRVCVLILCSGGFSSPQTPTTKLTKPICPPRGDPISAVSFRCAFCCFFLARYDRTTNLTYRFCCFTPRFAFLDSGACEINACPNKKLTVGSPFHPQLQC